MNGNYQPVQSNTNVTLTAATSRSQTFTNDVQAGNSLFGWIVIVGATLPTVTDNLGQTWHTKFFPAQSPNGLLFFWLVNSSAGTITVTVNWTGSVTTSPLLIHEVSGIPSNFTFDQNQGNTLTGTTLHLSTASNNYPTAFQIGILWNSAENLTDPPGLLPVNSVTTLLSHGKVGNSLYADSWAQGYGCEGWVVSPSTAGTIVARITFSAPQAPFVNGSFGESYNTPSAATQIDGLGTSAVTAGHTLIAVLNYSTDNNSPTGEPSSRTVSDGLNTWVEGVHVWNNTQHCGFGIWYCLSALAGSSMVGINGFISGNFSGGIFPADALEISVFDLAVTGYTLVSSSSTAYQMPTQTFAAGSITPSNDNSLVVGVIQNAITGWRFDSGSGLWFPNPMPLTSQWETFVGAGSGMTVLASGVRSGFQSPQGTQCLSGCFVQPYAAVVKPTFYESQSATGNAAALVLETFSPSNFTVLPITQNVAAGLPTTYTIQTMGFAGTVTPSVFSGLVSGMTATFSPTTVAGSGGISVMTIGTSTAVPAGTYSIVVQCTDGITTHHFVVTLIVTSYTVTLSSSTLTLDLGQSGTVTATVDSGGGGSFTDLIELSSSGQPSGMDVLFSTDLIAGTGDVVITVTVDNTVTPGVYTLTIEAADGTITQTATLTVTVLVGEFSQRWVSI